MRLSSHHTYISCNVILQVQNRPTNPGTNAGAMKKKAKRVNKANTQQTEAVVD